MKTTSLPCPSVQAGFREPEGSSMKNKKKLHARDLYINTGLSKTQIAARLNVDRKTIYRWVTEDNWDRLKRSAMHLPSMVAEHCYYLLARLTTHILSDLRGDMPATHKEADAIHKLALTINKLKNRSTVNESMEMFTFFLEGLRAKDPALAGTILPHIDDFIEQRSGIYMSDFRPPGFTDYGTILPTAPDITEQKLDEQAHAELYGTAPNQ